MSDKNRDVVGWLRGLWHGKRPMVVAVVVLVAGLPVVISLALMNKDKPSQAVDQLVGQAQKATDTGDYADALAKLKAAEGKEASSAQKVALYADLAAAAANAGKTQDAINYLQKKHELAPDSAKADAFMLARLYERAGDKVDALAQYRLALEYYKQQPQTDSITAQGTVANIEAAIAELEAGNE